MTTNNAYVSIARPLVDHELKIKFGNRATPPAAPRRSACRRRRSSSPLRCRYHPATVTPGRTLDRLETISAPRRTATDVAIPAGRGQVSG